MPTDPTQRLRVDVALGIVVENMSTPPCAKPVEQSERSTKARDPSAPRVLITRRRAEQVLGGYWELPGGKVEAGESAKQALVRELREEVDIDVVAIDALPAVEHDYEHASVRLLPFVCRLARGTPRAVEVADVRWVALHQLDQYRFPQASLPIIASLMRYLDPAAPTTPLARGSMTPNTDTTKKP